jgi:predicted RNase H-like nuclease
VVVVVANVTKGNIKGPTKHFGIPRFRVDLFNRLVELKRFRNATRKDGEKVTLNEIVNEMMEYGIKMEEGMNRRRQAVKEEKKRVNQAIRDSRQEKAERESVKEEY